MFRNNYTQYKRGNYQQATYAPKQTFKKSSCNFEKKDAKTPTRIWGWKKTKSGLVSMSAFAYKNTKEKADKNGTLYLNYMVVLTNKDSGQITKTSGMYYPQEKKLRIPSNGWIGSANGSGTTRSGKFAKGFLGPVSKR